MIKRGKGQFTVPKIQRYDYVFPVFSENGVSIMVPEPCCMPMNHFPEPKKIKPLGPCGPSWAGRGNAKRRSFIFHALRVAGSWS